MNWHDIETGDFPPKDKDLLGVDVHFGGFYICHRINNAHYPDIQPYDSGGTTTYIRWWCLLPEVEIDPAHPSWGWRPEISQEGKR